MNLFEGYLKITFLEFGLPPDGITLKGKKYVENLIFNMKNTKVMFI